MGIGVGGGANVQLIVKGKVTLNSNGGNGIDIVQVPNSNLEINVESSGATLETCGNIGLDIGGNVGATAPVTFSGTGYTCDQAKVQFFGSDGSTVVPPACQDCPSN